MNAFNKSMKLILSIMHTLIPFHFSSVHVNGWHLHDLCRHIIVACIERHFFLFPLCFLQLILLQRG